MTPSITELEAMLRANVAKARADGWRIVTDAFGSRAAKTCCLASAGNPDIAKQWIPERMAADYLGISLDQVCALIRGFDGKTHSDYADVASRHTAFYALGAKLRRELL